MADFNLGSDITGAFKNLQDFVSNPIKNIMENNKQPDPVKATGDVLADLNVMQSNYTNYSLNVMMRQLGLKNINQSDWNKSFPYSLVIMEATHVGKYIPRVEYVLPINPQDFSISTPFAINTTVTSRGILEEHNGAPLRMINISGTTGIYPKRKSAIDTNNQTALQSIMGTTIQAADNLKSSLQYLISNITENGNNQQKETIKEEDQYSGYYQLHILRAFLELYVELKRKTIQSEQDKTTKKVFDVPGLLNTLTKVGAAKKPEFPKSHSWRLVLLNRKDNAAYLITPKNFTYKKTAASPMEYTYQFQALAWGTVDPKEAISTENTRNSIIKNDLNWYQRLTNGIRAARNVIINSKNLISAIKGDIQNNIIGPVNNVVLALSDAASIPQEIADFPKELRSSFMGTVLYNFNILRDQISNVPSAVPIKDYLQNVADSFNTNKSLSKTSARSNESNIDTSALLEKTIPGTSETGDTALNLFSLQSLPLTLEQSLAMNKTLNDAAETNTNDVKKLITNLNDMSNALESIATEQGVDSPYWPILYACNEINDYLHSLLSADFFEAGTAASLINNYYINAGTENGIPLQDHTGKILVPFPYGSTLEWLAQRYLGDASRWLEIVSANNLKAPYIDETGFTVDFLTNGSDRQVNIDDITNLYVGQFVWIYSNTKSINRRKVLSIKKISSSNYIITLDGDTDLSSYTTADKAKMKAYLPFTVNSQKMIYIPVDSGSNLEEVTTSLSGKVDISEEMLDMSYVDIALDSNGDILLQPDGTTNLSYGVANLIQSLIIKFNTVAGQLLLHPSFGGGVEIGSAEVDFFIKELKDSIINTVISDPRFKAVNNLNIVQDSGTVTISMTVVTANNDVLPIGFSIK